MKNFIFVPFLLLLFTSTGLVAQTPVPDPDTVETPVQQGDPTMDQLPARLDYIEDKKRISAEELPAPVRETLESGDHYAGWKEGVIFEDRNTEEYIIELKEGAKTKSYRFNKEGRPIVEE